VAGVQVQLPMFRRTLLNVGWRGVPAGAVDQDAIRRPTAVTWTDGTAQHRIEFKWESGAGSGVTLKYDKGSCST
jgi:hypothetical protein